MPERLRLERELADLGVREHDTSVDRSKVREVFIGELITIDDYKNLPDADLVWTVPGIAVTSYTGDKHTTKLEPLTEAERKKPVLTFHWVDAQSGRVVQCRGTFKFGQVRAPLYASFVFDVKAPTLDRFAHETSEPRIVVERQDTGIRLEGRRKKTIKLGKGEKTIEQDVPGIQWDWQVTMPAKLGGCIKDLQTVRMGREKMQRLRPGSSRTRKLVLKHPKAPPGDQLDQPPDEGGPEPTYSSKALPTSSVGFPRKLKAGETFAGDASDSPFMPLKPLDVSASVDETFKYFILWKPDKDHAIWVPLAKAEWFWKAKAKRQGAKWVLTEKSGGVCSRGSLSSEFPQYDSNAHENMFFEP